MSAKKKSPEVNVSYANGFLHGRLVTVDETDGFEVTCPGVLIRLRISEIVAYCNGPAHCVEVQVKGVPDNYEVWGTIEVMDTVISRDRMDSVPSADEVVPKGFPEYQGSDPKVPVKLAIVTSSEPEPESA